ncbi:MAG: hypothetical protein EOO10_08605, partial [Chitinophagaceae bacterium]
AIQSYIVGLLIEMIIVAVMNSVALLLLGGCSDEKTNAVSTKEASSTSATNTEDPATSTKIPTTPERLARQRNNNKGKTGADGAVTETEEKNNQQEDGKGDGDFPQETSGETPQPQVRLTTQHRHHKVNSERVCPR